MHTASHFQVEIDVDSFDIRVVAESIFAQFATHARLFVAPERRVDVGVANAVDPDSTSLQPVRRFDSPGDILREYRARQAVSRIIRLPNRILVILELDKDNHRAEDLLADNLHVGLAVSEDCGLDEVAFHAVAFATVVACSAFSFAGFDIPHNAVILLLRDLCSLESGVVERIPNLEALCLLRELVYKLVVNLGVNKNPRAGTARLSLVEENSNRGPINSLFHVTIVEDDTRRFASKLKCDVLQVALSRRLRDLPSNDSAAGERDLLDIHMRRNGRTDGVSIPDQDVQHTWGQTGLGTQVAEEECSEGCEFGTFEYDRVAGSECRSDFPC